MLGGKHPVGFSWWVTIYIHPPIITITVNNQQIYIYIYYINELFKQIDGCPMGGSLSVVFAGIFMAKMEEEIVKPYNPLFYKRYGSIITKTSVGKDKGRLSLQ